MNCELHLSQSQIEVAIFIDREHTHRIEHAVVVDVMATQNPARDRRRVICHKQQNMPRITRLTHNRSRGKAIVNFRKEGTARGSAFFC